MCRGAQSIIGRDLIFDVERAVLRVKNERGAAMAEYGLLLALVALAAFASLVLFGDSLLGLFTDATDEFSAINNPPAP